MKNVSFSIKVYVKNALDGIKTVTKAFTDVKEEAEKASGTASRFGGICGKLTMPNFAAIVSVVNNVGSSFAQAADTGMAFGQRMADLSAITGIAGDELKQLEANARRFGKESGLGADTAARSYTVLASQIQVSEIGMEGLNKLQEKSITLAHASGMSLDAAAESLAGTINQFGLGADEAGRVINVLAAGSKYGAAEISELSQSFKVVGAAASAMGMGVESTAGALEVLSKANLKGAEAGTSLRNIILKLNTTLGIDLGETSLGAALDALKPKLSDATYLSKLFGAENIAAAQFLIQNAAAVDEMTRQLTGTNVAEEQAAIRTKTTAQRMAELRAQMDDVKIAVTGAAGSMGPYVMILSENADKMVMFGAVVKSAMTQISYLNRVVGKLTGATLTHRAATIAASAATKAWSAVQAVLNGVMKMNPLGMLVTVIGTLAGAAVACYHRFEGFRSVCDATWDAVKRLSSAVWDVLVAAFERVSEVVRMAWQWIKRFFGIKDAESAGQTAAALDEQTEAIGRNADARRKLGSLKLDFGNTGNGGSDEKKEVPVTLRGLDENALKAKLQEVQAQIDAAPDIETKLALLPDKLALEQVIEGIRTRLEREAFAIKVGVTQQQADARATPGTVPTLQPTLETTGLEQQAAQAAERMQALFRDPVEIKPDTRGLKKLDKQTEDACKSVGELGSSLSQIGSNIGVPALDVMGTIAQAIANIALSYSMALAQSSALGPFGWIAFAAAGLAQMTAVIASIKNATAFANGGIVSGPTYALVGEYAGASGNPEVIAPLDRLRTLLQPAYADGTTMGEVEFSIRGDRLRGILQRKNRRTERS